MNLASLSLVITCQSIKGEGAGYMERHLAANDYWSEGETMTGEWFGEAAGMLGLAPGSAVTSAQFGAIGSNRHPATGDKLTAVDNPDRKAWTDIQLSAPKDVSVLALVGGDERVREAFHESVRTALGELQAFAGVRERRGILNASEEVRETGNLAAAVYHHDASRKLDPQLHSHAVVANATWDKETGRWMALQARDMMRASVYARQVLYTDLAARLGRLGYQTHNHTDTGFEVRGMEHLRERYSRRDAEVEKLAQAWEKEHGRAPSKKEREILVRESRDRKLTEITTPEVRAAQQAQLTPAERRGLSELVATASAAPSKPMQPVVPTQKLDAALEGGLRHVHERASVGRQWDVLSAAMAHASAGTTPLDGRALRERLVARAVGEGADLHAAAGWRVVTAEVAAEERQTVNLAVSGRDAFPAPLASAEALERPAGPVTLSPEQKAAAKTLAASRDGTSVLIGDAGTGKTTLLQAVQAASDHQWVALGPTTRARDELKANGFQADTVAKFLASKKLQAVAPGSVLLVDEAGTLSMPQLRQLQEIAARQKCRLLLVGDAKQHQAVERGDALRAVLDRAREAGSPLNVARLQTVRRQRIEEHREIAGMIAGGKVLEALEKQKGLGIVQEVKNERGLIEKAADHYVARRQALATGAGPKQKPGEVLGIAPLWQDAERFSAAVRTRLRDGGQLQGADRAAGVVEPLGWTKEKTKVAARYKAGEHILTFNRKQEAIGAKAGENWMVEAVEAEGLRVRRLDDSLPRPGQRRQPAPPAEVVPWSGLVHASVGRLHEIKLAVGDSILMRGNCRAGKKTVAANGEVRRVESIGKDGRIRLAGGGVLPATFRHYQHGYAVTSHKSQGASVAESVVVMGADACRQANRRQWYVSSTRHKEDSKIFAADVSAVASALHRDTAAGRELVAEVPQRPVPAPRMPAEAPQPVPKVSPAPTAPPVAPAQTAASRPPPAVPVPKVFFSPPSVSNPNLIMPPDSKSVAAAKPGLFKPAKPPSTPSVPNLIIANPPKPASVPNLMMTNQPKPATPGKPALFKPAKPRPAAINPNLMIAGGRKAATPSKPAPTAAASTPIPAVKPLFGSGVAQQAAKLARQALVAAAKVGKAISGKAAAPAPQKPAPEKSPAPSRPKLKGRGLELGL